MKVFLERKQFKLESPVSDYSVSPSFQHKGPAFCFLPNSKELHAAGFASVPNQYECTCSLLMKLVYFPTPNGTKTI
jgi:hypothetical protein